jgi:hypothetical protein
LVLAALTDSTPDCMDAMRPNTSTHNTLCMANDRAPVMSDGSAHDDTNVGEGYTGATPFVFIGLGIVVGSQTFSWCLCDPRERGCVAYIRYTAL